MTSTRMERPAAVGAALVLLIGLVSLASAEAAIGTKTTSLVSASNSGAQGSGVSEQPVVSADGRYVAFVSSASNLVAGDTNDRADIFLRDLAAGTTQRVNLTSAGQQVTGIFTVGANGKGSLDLSGNGRVVAFNTNAALVPEDTNGTYDVYVRDIATHTTERLSVSGTKSGSSASDVSVSHDGRWVAYVSSQLSATSTRVDVLVHDRLNGTNEIVSRRDATVPSTTRSGSSGSPSVSADGRYVAYASAAADQVPGDTNGDQDVFVRDLGAGTTTRVSVPATGAQAEGSSVVPAISGTGRYVTFLTHSATVLTGDSNGQADYVLKDTESGTVEQVSVGNGTSGVASYTNEGRAPVSDDGRYVAFSSRGSLASPTLGLAQAYLRDTVEDTTDVVTAGSNGISTGVSLSAEGHHVAFSSGATNLIPGSPTSNRQAFLTTYERDTTPVDTTPPTVVPMMAPDTADGDNGWFRADVTLTWVVTDSESTVETTGCADQAITVDQSPTVYSCTATSEGGTTGPVVVEIGRDATKPTIEAFVAPAAPDGAAGWYVTAPTATFLCEDATSGIATCTPPEAVSEGSASTVGGTAVDKAGNSLEASAGPFTVDLTDPEVACEPAAPVLLGGSAEVSALVTDATSGPVNDRLSVAVDTTAVGDRAVSITGVDNAGRRTTVACDYQVRYAFSGFQQPVDPDVVNVVKAGSAVPLKWHLEDAHGAPVTDLTEVRLQVSTVPCDPTQEEDPITETVPAGSGLQNLGAGNYQYNWKTLKGYGGSCRVLGVDLGEGKLRNVEFRFTR